MKRSPIRRWNAKRRAKRKAAGEVYGPYHAWISAQPCHYRGRNCWGEVKGHHVKTVGAGGKDYANQVPLCAQHHAEAHAARIPKAELAEIALQYAELHP